MDHQGLEKSVNVYSVCRILGLFGIGLNLEELQELSKRIIVETVGCVTCVELADP